MKRILFAILTLILLVACSQEVLEENKDIENLIQKLSDDDYDTRQNASNKLTEIGEEAVPYVISSLNNDPYNDTSSSSFNSRWNKVNVLGRIGSNKAEDILIDRILNDEETHVRWRAIWALSIVKSNETENKLIKALKDQKTAWRAAVVLGSMKNKEAKETLVSGLKSDDDWIRWEGIYVLGILEDTSTAKPIAELLNDPSLRVRQEAALTLGKLNDKDVIPNLITALQDESSGVRWRTASSLEKLNAKEAIPYLEKALNKETDQETIGYINNSLEKLQQ